MILPAADAPISDWASTYITQYGLALVPIPPGKKGPTGEAWNKPGGYFTDAEKARAFWLKNPKHNMGAVLGPGQVCSLDVDDVQWTRHVLYNELGLDLDAMALVFPTVVGNPARFRILFRMPAGLELAAHKLTWPNEKDPDGSLFKSATARVVAAKKAKDKVAEAAAKALADTFKTFTVLELRAGLVQDVLPPSIHPETGKPYTWRTPPGDELPELTPELLAIWQNWDAFKRDAEASCPWRPEPKKVAKKPAKKLVPAKPGSGASVIEQFNQVHDVESLLEAHGYERKGRKYLCPHSSTGLPGITVADGRMYSHHGSDPLANGHQNDAFDVFCILEHNGDQGAAVKAAARILGIEYTRSDRQPEPPALGELPPPSAYEELPEDGELPPAPSDDEEQGPADEEGVEGDSLNLNKLLRRYALIVGTTNVWDTDKARKMKRAAFEAHVGRELYKEWAAVVDSKRKKRISEEQVKEIEDARKMAGKKLDAMSMPPLIRYVFIDGTKDAWDCAKKRRLPEGALKMALGDAYNLWLNSAERRVVDVEQIVFDPTLTVDPKTHINTYEGLPLEPVRNPAACENLRWLVDFLCNHDEKAATWLKRWLAFPLQHSGAKMDTAVLMHSIIEGSGKSLLNSVVMGRIYGQYAATVGQTQLEGNFNAWQSGKLWAVFEEVVSRDQRYNQVGKIKQLITGQTVRIESKFVNGWEEASHMNAVFLSNEIMPWPISEGDRRFLVLWPEATLPEDRQKAIKHELANGGVEAFHGWLLDVDLGDFDPQTKPPVTPARDRLVALSRSTWQTFLHLWKVGDLGNGLWGPCLSSDLYGLFIEWCQKNKEHSMSHTKFSLFISAEVQKTRPIPWTDGNTRRFGAFFFPDDPASSPAPSLKAPQLGKAVVEWRDRAKLAGWNVDNWDHVKAVAA